MKTIKIHRNSALTKKQAPDPSTAYSFLLSSNPNASSREQLGSMLAQLCQLIENKTPVKLNLQGKIRGWLEAGKTGESGMGAIGEFRSFVIEVVEGLIKSNERWQKSTTAGQKVIRIKSQQRIKLRLLKQTESPTTQLYETEQLKQQESKQKQLYELKAQNKALQRKIVLLSAEFNQIKNAYEVKIEKYKRLLNSSLMTLQREVEMDLEGDGEYGMPYYQASTKYNQMLSPRGNQGYQGNLRSARSQQHRKMEFHSNQGRMTTQESAKMITIPTIPVLESAKKFDRQLSQRNYRQG